MKILFASAEVKPFSKVGGLADVVGSLPKYLEKDAEIAVFTPLHGCIDKEKWGLKHVENSKLHMQFGWSSNNFELYMAKMPDTNINVFFIDNPKYFGCFDCVYPYNIDERYNHERFIAFSKTVDGQLLFLMVNKNEMLSPVYKMVLYCMANSETNIAIIRS